MRKLILIAQTSVEGYVAGPAGDFNSFTNEPKNLEFVCSLTANADSALFGRVSYQLLNANWPTAAAEPGADKDVITYSNWYNKVSKYVLSKTLLQSDVNNATVIHENIALKINALKKQEGKDILIFGSPTAIHSLLELKLLDQMWLIVHPVLFGKGIPLFKNNASLTQLKLVHSSHLPGGTIHNQYSL